MSSEKDILRTMRDVACRSASRIRTRVVDIWCSGGSWCEAV